MCENGIDSKNSKHIDIKYCFIQKCIERGDVKLKYVKSSENLADLFTKRLPGTKVIKVVDQLGLRIIFFL